MNHLVRLLGSTVRKKLGRNVSKVVSQNYSLTKAYKYTDFYLSHLAKKDDLIIYQMGKVGSTTVLRSLSKVLLDTYIYQVFVLNRESLKRLDDVYRNASKTLGKVLIGDHIITSMYLCRKLERKPPHQRIKVVTLTRDPIAQNISAFFHAFDNYFPDIARQYKGKTTGFEADIDVLLKLYFEKWDHLSPLSWFDDHMKPVFNIDVYSERFPQSQGYKIIKGHDVDLLIIRLESLNACASEAFRDFLGINNFSLVTQNIATRKDYGQIYKRFSERIVFPDSFEEKMYTSKFVRHFYSSEEIASFKEKWRKHKRV